MNQNNSQLPPDRFQVGDYVISPSNGRGVISTVLGVDFYHVRFRFNTKMFAGSDLMLDVVATLLDTSERFDE